MTGHSRRPQWYLTAQASQCSDNLLAMLTRLTLNLYTLHIATVGLHSTTLKMNTDLY
nr:MAG TPA: hypothetical protein [Caudoviricetes sp.]